MRIPGGAKISKGRFLGAVSPGSLGAPENVGMFFCHGNIGNWQKYEDHTIGDLFFSRIPESAKRKQLGLVARIYHDVQPTQVTDLMLFTKRNETF